MSLGHPILNRLEVFSLRPFEPSLGPSAIANELPCIIFSKLCNILRSDMFILALDIMYFQVTEFQSCRPAVVDVLL